MKKMTRITSSLVAAGALAAGGIGMASHASAAPVAAPACATGCGTVTPAPAPAPTKAPTTGCTSGCTSNTGAILKDVWDCNPVGWIANGLMLDVNLLTGLSQPASFLNLPAWVNGHIEWIKTPVQCKIKVINALGGNVPLLPATPIWH